MLLIDVLLWHYRGHPFLIPGLCVTVGGCLFCVPSLNAVYRLLNVDVDVVIFEGVVRLGFMCVSDCPCECTKICEKK